MAGIARNEPGEPATQEYAGNGYHRELRPAPGTDYGAQHQQRKGVGRDMAEVGMQEGSPNDAGQPIRVPRHDAMLRQVPMPDQVVEPKDQPADARQRDYRHESREPGLSCLVV